MKDNYDQLALSWVRKEINNTLDQARKGLENFAEDTQDQTQIQFCINCLHQVQGTLQMLEFTGAARLAQEMEALAEKMSSETRYAVEFAFEVLMRALLQMPGYLEKVEDGQKDIPVILLPLINELRGAHGQTLLTEQEVFSANTAGVVPPRAIEKASDQDKTRAFQDNAKKLRAHFQKGLTGVIRTQNIKESLSRIHKVLIRIEALTEGHPVARLWWVADGFIFSITEKGLYKKKEIHMLLAQVDKQIKRLSDEGERALNDVIPEELLSKLLYYVARSNSKNARVQSLKKEFNLESSLSDSKEVKERQDKLTRPDSTAITSVVDAINEELASVKDQLDLFVRSKSKDLSQLLTLVNSLSRISDTLTLLELAIPRDVIRQQMKSIQKLIDLNQAPEDAVIMDVAGALLFVEANLKNVNLEMDEKETDEADSEKISQAHAKESQVDEATSTLIKVARKSMQLAKDKLIDFIASGFDKETVSEVPILLDEVIGGTRIIQFGEAADILLLAKKFIEKRIIDINVQPREKHLDALADVVTSVEYYLEASEEGKHRGLGSILKGAQKSIDTLEASLAEEINEVDNIIVPDSETAVVDSPQFEFVEKTEEKADVIPFLAPASEKEADESLIDEEVLEIFLEEAEEETQIIEEILPRWAENVHDEEALTTMRRSFHTLKGSGRLVGATIIGDVSWAIENMLNKVIEESIPAEMPVISIMTEVQQMLPRLVEHFAKQTTCDLNYQQLIAKANHISSGKPVSEFNENTGVSTKYIHALSDSPDVEAELETVVEEAIDPVLLEIFSTEAESHLQTINDYIKAASSEGSVAVTDDLIRALHTLKGSASMAAIEHISGLTGPWEKYARLIKGSGKRFEQSVMQILKETYKALAGSVQNLNDGKSINVDNLESLQQKVMQLDANVKAASVSGKHRDQQFVSIFLTEGLDVLHEVTKLNDELAEDFTNETVKESIKTELDAFHRGAQLLGIEHLEVLADSTERLAGAIVGRNNINSEFTQLMAESIELLLIMLNKIASEEDLVSPEAITSKMTRWIEALSTSSVPEDMDVELVELFVEEGEELIETAQDLFTRWKDNLESKDIIGELRRIFHTIKGSSRMAGAMAIGDLGHAAEDIFNTIVDFGRKVESDDYEIILATTNKLDSMIAELKSLRWPVGASKEIKVIRRYLSPDDVEAEVEVEEELVEDSAVVELPESSEVIDEIPMVVDAVSEDDAHLVMQQEEDISDSSELKEEFSLSDDSELEVDSPSVVEGSGEKSSADHINVLDEEFEFDSQPVFEIEDTISDSLEIDEPVIDEPVIDESLVEELIEDELVEDELVADDSSIELGTGDKLEEAFSSESEVIEEAAEEDEVASVKSSLADAEKIDGNIVDFSEVESPVTEIVVEDTISPAAPIIVTGNIHKVELDEDGEEVLDIYLEEAEELLVALDEGLHDWSVDLQNKEAVDLLQRTLHTFKGGARLTDLVILGDLTHEMETYFEKLHTGVLNANQQAVDFLLQGYDVIESLVTEVRDLRQMTLPEQYLKSLHALIKGEQPVFATEETDSTEDSPVAENIEAFESKKTDKQEESDTVKTHAAEVVSFEKAKQDKAEFKPKPQQIAEVVRIPSEQLESIVNLAGETSIYRSRQEQQMSVFRYNLEEMSSTIERLRDQLRNLEIETDAQISYRREISGGTEYEDFDPLEMDRYTRQQELTRGLSESSVDLLSLKETLDSLMSDSETLLLQQGRVNTEMQEGLMRTRLTPFESLVPRLRRMVRQISTELGKTIELSITADGEMDRTVLDRMIAPLEHMLRNAMDHGIESPEERRANNKSEKGTVKISLYREGNEVFIKINDDGRGLNLEAIRKKALEKGLITINSTLTDHELQQLILEAGFSTAEKITQISGRGVGMDVVSSEIKQLGGVIEIDSTLGTGTTFTVKLPFTMSVNHALMVQLGEEVYAIPLANIEGIVRVSPFELEEYYSDVNSSFEYAGIDYSMYYLGQILDHQTAANLEGVTHPLPVLLLHGADHPTALQVDDLLGSREIVVKSIGTQLSSISGLSGATILGDGRVVMILDMPALIRRIDATVISDDDRVVDVADDKAPVVMVVDDSITVRKVTTRLLERNDFEVITAKDGVDALTVLGEIRPDVMLLDIEMPRMDGFELATIIRHDEAMKDLPIIMITSRTGEKHRERAEQIGVNQYMGKPYNEVDLLDSISALLPNKS